MKITNITAKQERNCPQMNTDENRFILGKKTRTEILKDAENRFIQLVIAALFWFTGMILVIIFSLKSFANDVYEKIVIIAVGLLFIVGTVLTYMGNRCPFCNKLKWFDYWENRYFAVRKWTYKCYNCNLSDKQIKEIVDMLIRGVEIDKETIASFNKRDL